MELVEDVMVQILKLIDTKSLIKFSICNKNNLLLLQRNIYNFNINVSNSQITDMCLENFKGVRLLIFLTVIK